MPSKQRIRVTAAIIRCAGQVLLARRRPGSYLAGKWEFPGGKIEDAETAEGCLARELEEEFGLAAKVGEFITSSRFDYGQHEIELLAFEAQLEPGEWTLVSHDEARWVSTADLLSYELAPADIPIAEAIVNQSCRDGDAS